jgi:hypothetical protein
LDGFVWLVGLVYQGLKSALKMTISWAGMKLSGIALA